MLVELLWMSAPVALMRNTSRYLQGNRLEQNDCQQVGARTSQRARRLQLQLEKLSVMGHADQLLSADDQRFDTVGAQLYHFS